MAKLKSKQRKRLPKSAFALPSKRKYPLDTKKRARAALAYAARSNTAGSPATIRRAVLKRYPSLKKKTSKRK
jgi:hypothetical protein